MVKKKYFWFTFFLLLMFINTIETKHKRKENEFTILSSEYDHNSIKIYRFLENQKHSYVIFIRDYNHNEYLIKQEKSGFLLPQFNPIFEKLTSHIASMIGISCQQVELLPINFCFPGKFLCQRPATIHKVLPGKTIRELDNNFGGKYFSIKQTNEPGARSMGFNQDTIANMSQHPDLPPIVAFDTFMGQRDRNGANIIYDEKHNRFYAIDNALIHDTKHGKMSVGQLACNYIEHITRQKKNIFNEREYRALVIYHTVLQKLVDLFPPEEIYILLEKFVEQSGLYDKYGFDNQFISIMNTYKERIYTAHEDTQKLIFLLAKLLKSLNKKFI